MNSLEFVNDRIRSYETMLLTAIDTKCSKKQIRYYEERLNIFQQIKAELEAWEVVKEELQIVSRGKNRRGEKLQKYELYVIGQDKINTLNKGLEVEDE